MRARLRLIAIDLTSRVPQSAAVLPLPAAAIAPCSKSVRCDAQDWIHQPANSHLLGLIGRHREGSPASNLSTIGVSNWTQLTAQCLVGQIATPQFQTWREGHDLIDLLGDVCSVNDSYHWGQLCAPDFTSFLRPHFSRGLCSS